MASCDVQATLSNNKLEKITECTSKVEAASKITDTSSAIASALTQVESKTEALNVIMNVNLNSSVETVVNKSDSLLQPTKIPAPIHLGNGFNNRKYTTLMKSLDTNKKQQHDDTFSSTSTLVNTTVDSGVQMNCSTVEDDNLSCELQSLRPGSLAPRKMDSTETIVSMDSMLGLETAEQQTLRVLQRAVAEMEADVALHSEKLELEIKLDVDRQLKLAMEEQQQDQTEFKDMCQAVEIVENFPIAIATGVTERKHVRVEELLDAEHDMEMLHKLLQKDNQLVNSDAPEQSQSGDNLSQSEVVAPREDDETEGPQKPVGLVYSLLHIICGKRIRKLSYPILFCGMAVGLLFYFRKE